MEVFWYIAAALLAGVGTGVAGLSAATVMAPILIVPPLPGKQAPIKRDLPILEAYDMTAEAVCAKLMWILGQTTDRKWVEELFYTPVACDILTGQ